MIERLLLAHVAVASASGSLSAAARGRPFRPSAAAWTR
jgi:hypothetical protein